MKIFNKKFFIGAGLGLIGCTVILNVLGYSNLLQMTVPDPYTVQIISIINKFAYWFVLLFGTAETLRRIVKKDYKGAYVNIALCIVTYFFIMLGVTVSKMIVGI